MKGGAIGGLVLYKCGIRNGLDRELQFDVVRVTIFALKLGRSIPGDPRGPLLAGTSIANLVSAC